MTKTRMKKNEIWLNMSETSDIDLPNLEIM